MDVQFSGLVLHDFVVRISREFCRLEGIMPPPPTVCLPHIYYFLTVLTVIYNERHVLKENENNYCMMKRHILRIISQRLTDSQACWISMHHIHKGQTGTRLMLFTNHRQTYMHTRGVLRDGGLWQAWSPLPLHLMIMRRYYYNMDAAGEYSCTQQVLKTVLIPYKRLHNIWPTRDLLWRGRVRGIVVDTQTSFSPIREVIYARTTSPSIVIKRHVCM